MQMLSVIFSLHLLSVSVSQTHQWDNLTAVDECERTAILIYLSLDTLPQQLQFCKMDNLSPFTFTVVPTHV